MHGVAVGAVLNWDERDRKLAGSQMPGILSNRYLVCIKVLKQAA